jgi:acyl carrier protein
MPLTVDDVRRRLANVLATRVVRMDPQSLSAETPLIKSGLNLDSVALLEFVVGIEEEFGIVFDDAALTADRFRSLGTLAQYIHDIVITPAVRPA